MSDEKTPEHKPEIPITAIKLEDWLESLPNATQLFVLKCGDHVYLREPRSDSFYIVK